MGFLPDATFDAHQTPNGSATGAGAYATNGAGSGAYVDTPSDDSNNVEDDDDDIGARPGSSSAGRRGGSNGEGSRVSRWCALSPSSFGSQAVDILNLYVIAFS